MQVGMHFHKQKTETFTVEQSLELRINPLLDKAKWECQAIELIHSDKRNVLS